MDRKFIDLCVAGVLLCILVAVYPRPTPAVNLGTFDTAPIYSACRTCNSPLCSCDLCKCDDSALCSIRPVSAVEEPVFNPADLGVRIVPTLPSSDEIAAAPSGIVCENGVCRIRASGTVASGNSTASYRTRFRVGSRLFSSPLFGFGRQVVCRIFRR